MKRWAALGLSLVLLVGLAGIGGCYKETPPASPVKVELSIANAPALGRTAELTCIVTSHYDAMNVTAEIILPDAFELVSGNLSWKGDIASNGQGKFKFMIKSVKIGNWAIEARAGYLPRGPGGGWYGDTDYIYISVSEDSAQVSEKPLVKEPPVFAERLDPSKIPSMIELPPQQGVIPPAVLPPPEASLKTISLGSSGVLKVTGKWWCYISEDSLPPEGEKRNDEMQPMVWGAVYIYDGNDNFLGSGTTGPGGSIPEGEFEIYVENPGPVGFYVKTKPHTEACHVTTDWPWYSDYWSQTPMFYPDPLDTEYDIGEWVIPDDPAYKGAWRIYETIANDHYDRGAWDFLKYEGPGWTQPEITVRFPADETVYAPGSHVIEIEEEDYTKALDVVQHEYGHAVMHAVYDYYWPETHCPSPHYITQYSHPNCAWTEGWANFFPLTVQSFGRWDDAVFEWGTGGQEPLETPTWGTPGWDNGAGVEGRVAGALWDIYDSHDDGYDQYDGDFDDIWDTFYNQNDDTFAEFWEAWKDRGHNEDDAAWAIYQNTICFIYDIPLAEDWNLISLPLIPDNRDIEVVLEDISSNMMVVWHYNATTADWQWYVPNNPGSTLSSLDDGKCYWIKMTDPDTLTVRGLEEPLPGQPWPEYDVFEGWNMVGFTSTSSMHHTSYLYNLDDEYSILWGWDTEGQDYFNVYPLGEHGGNMEPMYGYWLYATADGTIVPPEGDGGSKSASDGDGAILPDKAPFPPPPPVPPPSPPYGPYPPLPPRLYATGAG